LNLFNYWNKLYKEAQSKAEARPWLLAIELFLLVFLLYSEANSILTYLMFLGVVLIHVYTEYLKHQINRLNMLGFKLQKVDMLQQAYKEIPSKYEISDLIAEASFLLNENIELKSIKFNNEYNIRDKSSPEKILLSQIQENSFWNYHLYKFMYLKKIKFFLISLSFIFICLFIAYLIIPITIDSFKILFVILSFGIIYEIFDDIKLFARASLEMNELDNEISRIYNLDNNHKNLISLIVKYHYVKAMCTHIDKVIYDKYKDGLNQAWDIRISGNIEEVLKILSFELDEVKSKWAITGGANLFIRNYKRKTSDIDIITSKEGLYEISKKLNIEIKNTFTKTETENIRSYFIQHKINGTTIDIIGDMEVLINDKWKLLHWNKELDSFQINDTIIPTTSLKYEKFTQQIISKQAINKMLTFENK